MNVLFVAVKERTKEIGILKALGSRRSVILLLFLLEASIIAVFGGAVGAAAGYVLIPLVNKLGTTAVAVSYAGILRTAVNIIWLIIPFISTMTDV